MTPSQHEIHGEAAAAHAGGHTCGYEYGLLVISMQAARARLRTPFQFPLVGLDDEGSFTESTTLL